MPSQVENDIRAWDAIVDHRTGTQGDHDTARWLVEQAREPGLEATLDWFDFTRRVPGRCEVACGEDLARGLPLFDGPVTPAAPVSGRAGHIGAPCEIAVATFTPAGIHSGTRALYEARGAVRPARAIVAIAAADTLEPGLAVLNAESYSAPYGPPVLQVSSDAAPWLQAAADAGGQLTVHAELSQTPGRACNVRIVIPGQDRRRPALVIMTPRSAWWTCTAERCGGIASWLACLRHFASHTPARDVIFIANTGHELSHLGLEHFLAHHGPLVQRAHAWIHLGANFAARGSRLRWQASEPGWLSRGSAALRALGHEVQLNPVTVRPLGEARNIFDAGGRFVSLLGDNRWFHNPADRWPAAVDLERCEALVNFVLDLAVDLAAA